MAGIVKNRGGREAVVLVFLLAATFFGCAKQQPVQVQPSPNANTEFPNANKALSLKVLSERARLFAGSSRFPEEVRHLAGLTKVTGYIIDRQNADIILTGRADKGAAPLDLDDLVTALRSAWLVYAKQQGAVCYVTPPGVTIDPDPAILHTLDQIKEKAFRQRNPLAIKEGLKEWERIAKSPQKARVLGLPPCRMAKIALHETNC
jgi:hypothetical protein